MLFRERAQEGGGGELTEGQGLGWPSGTRGLEPDDSSCGTTSPYASTPIVQLIRFVFGDRIRVFAWSERGREGGKRRERGRRSFSKPCSRTFVLLRLCSFFFFSSDCEQVGEGGTCVYRLINMSLDLEIFGFRWVGLSRGMREAMIGIPCM